MSLSSGSTTPCSRRSSGSSPTASPRPSCAGPRRSSSATGWHELARIDSRADAFGEFATLYGDPELANTRLDQIDAVDTAAVAAALQAGLAPANRSTLIYRKENA